MKRHHPRAATRPPSRRGPEGGPARARRTARRHGRGRRSMPARTRTRESGAREAGTRRAMARSARGDGAGALRRRAEDGRGGQRKGRRGGARRLRAESERAGGAGGRVGEGRWGRGRGEDHAGVTLGAGWVHPGQMWRGGCRGEVWRVASGVRCPESSVGGGRRAVRRAWARVRGIVRWHAACRGLTSPPTLKVRYRVAGVDAGGGSQCNSRPIPGHPVMPLSRSR
jgi:hypothetical protein